MEEIALVAGGHDVVNHLPSDVLRVGLHCSHALGVKACCMRVRTRVCFGGSSRSSVSIFVSSSAPGTGRLCAKATENVLKSRRIASHSAQRRNPSAPRARRVGRTGGRPLKLTADDIETAKALLANSDIGVTQIAHRLGVSPATLYRNTPSV